MQSTVQLPNRLMSPGIRFGSEAAPEAKGPDLKAPDMKAPEAKLQETPLPAPADKVEIKADACPTCAQPVAAKGADAKAVVDRWKVPTEITKSDRGRFSRVMAHVLRACGDSAYQQYFDLPRHRVTLSHQILESAIREAANERKPANHFFGSFLAWKRAKAKTFTSDDFKKLLPQHSDYAIEVELRFLWKNHFVECTQEGEGKNAVTKYYLTSKALLTMGFDPYTLKSDYKDIPLDEPPAMEMLILKELKKIADEQLACSETQAAKAQCVEKKYFEAPDTPHALFFVSHKLLQTFRKQSREGGSTGDGLAHSLEPVKVALDNLWRKGLIEPIMRDEVPEYLVKKTGIKDPQVLLRRYLLCPETVDTSTFSAETFASGWAFKPDGLALLDKAGKDDLLTGKDKTVLV